MKYAKYAILGLLVLAVVVSACTKIDDTQTKYYDENGTEITKDNATTPVETLFCTQDAKICQDGTSVARNPDNNCEFDPCLEDKDLYYVSEDPQQCMLMKFMCYGNMTPFFNDNGCGCQKPQEGKLQAFDCTDPRPTACTKEYMPVCGQVQVQCVKEPCPPMKTTFANKCEACANSLTISYTNGACSDPVDYNELEGMCLSVDGNWLENSKECEGISQSHCEDVMHGEFNECASACRNNPEAQVCTLQCVPVCQFKI